MSAFNKFQPFLASAFNGGVGNFSTDTLKAFLTNTAPTASHGTYSQESGNEIANGNGYATGGGTLTGVGSSQSGGTYTLSASNYTWTASGGSIGPFRYAVLYDSTSGFLIGWYDYGTAITVTSGNTFTLNLSNGIFQDS